MAQEKNWIWKLYLLIYIILATVSVIFFFARDTPMYPYYHILFAFNMAYFIVFCGNILSVLINLFSIIPFFLYVFQIKFLSLNFWKLIFITRVLLDFTARMYEWAFLKSIFYHNTGVGLRLSAFIVLAYLPSYYAQFAHAFNFKRKAAVNTKS